ncbi:MAG: hypothetical protein CMF99_09240 [Candidatus Marinimicrobia bacterium]|nr:hypothetical protein [Candidatus Neomarinimicrobiota bacterium]
MSLKITHSIIIVISIFLTGFFSYFMINSTDQSYSMTFSIGGILATVGLVYYLFTIIKKFKTL